ncbi:hypothetical protein QBA75_17070 [Streptomyces stelliscabiei]
MSTASSGSNPGVCGPLFAPPGPVRVLVGGGDECGEIRAVLAARRRHDRVRVRRRPHPQPPFGQTARVGAQRVPDLRGVQRPAQHGLEVRPVLGAEAGRGIRPRHPGLLRR